VRVELPAATYCTFHIPTIGASAPLRDAFGVAAVVAKRNIMLCVALARGTCRFDKSPQPALSGPPSSVLLVQRMTPAMEAEGEPLPVLNAGPKPHSPAWDADGRLLFIDGSGIKQFEIGGPTKAVFEGDAQLRGLSLSGTRLIAVRSPANVDIFAIPLRPGGLSAAGPAAPLISSTAEDYQPRFSPDGKHLAFVSDRSGSEELWLADADGGIQKQMTSLGAHILGFPRWSPVGSRSLFTRGFRTQRRSSCWMLPGEFRVRLPTKGGVAVRHPGPTTARLYTSRR
jgi:hypothetical protein